MSPILSLHHVTATVDEAQADLDFCIEALALRLVKKTVNFDNHHVYHFYYGNEHGTPGTIWTTFPYHGRGVPVGTKGVGQVTATSFSVPSGSLEFWHARLREQGIPAAEPTRRFGEEAMAFRDASGLDFELVANDRDQRAPWTPPAGMRASEAIRGLHSVTMTVRSRTRTIELMTRLLGFTIVNEMEGRTRMAVIDDEPGKTIDIVEAPDRAAAMNGLGTVHHVALAIATPEEQRQLREELIRFGCKVTEVRDRQYFQSIYFREPGGVLLEVATVQPGFAIDEELPCLGQDLKLPPWEEPHRASIEAGLVKVTYR